MESQQESALPSGILIGCLISATLPSLHSPDENHLTMNTTANTPVTIVDSRRQAMKKKAQDLTVSIRKTLLLSLTMLSYAAELCRLSPPKLSLECSRATADWASFVSPKRTALQIVPICK